TRLKKKAQRNTRDNVFNLSLFSESAKQIVEFLNYEKSLLCIDRKKAKAIEVLKWERPSNMKKRNTKRWNKEDDLFILSHPLQESIKKLNRTEKSIKARARRLSCSTQCSANSEQDSQ